MADLLIRFRRPRTMSDVETRAWLARRARSGRAGVALTRDCSPEEAQVHVSLAPDIRTSTEDYLLRLLMNDAG
jgi:hypothetical protein